MTHNPIDLDAHRSAEGQQQTTARREQALEDQAQRRSFLRRQAEREEDLLKAPYGSFEASARITIHLIELFALTKEGREPRRRRLIERALADLERLTQTGRDTPPPPGPKGPPQEIST
jgi:hypothetical protein